MIKFLMEEEALLGKKVISLLDQKNINIEIQSFADSESFVKILNIDSVFNNDIVFVKQFLFNSNISINDQIFRFLLASDFLKKAGANKIIGVLPYLAYSRQNKTFRGRFSGAIDLVGKFFKDSGIDDIVSFELHSSEIKKSFAVNLHEITMQNFWSNHLKTLEKEFKGSEYCLVSPDMGGIERVKKIAKILNKEFCFLEKKRVGPDKAINYDINGQINGRIALVVDDIIDTGNTAIQGCDFLLKNGAKKVFGFFTHAIFTPGTLERVENSNYEKIFVTDTVILRDEILNSKKIQVLSVCDLLCEYLRDNFYGKI